MRMSKFNSKGWYFNRQINLSVLIQIVLLASLILTSWINLQNQLDLLQRDVGLLLENQKDFAHRIERLSAESISYEYRLRRIEAVVNQDN